MRGVGGLVIDDLRFSQAPEAAGPPFTLTNSAAGPIEVCHLCVSLRPIWLGPGRARRDNLASPGGK